MKIAIISNLAWNIHNFRMPIAHHFKQLGHEVFLLGPSDGYEKYFDGFTFIPLNKLQRKGVNPIQDIYFLQELKQIFKQNQIECVFSYTPKVNIFTALASTPSTRVFTTVTGLGYGFINTGIVNKIQKLLYKIALKKSTKVFFQNNTDLQLFVNNGLVSKEKTHIIPGSGVDASKFVPKPKSTPAEETHFLFVGRLLIDKGIVELLHAANSIIKRHKQVYFHLVGGLDTEGNPMALRKDILDKYLSPQVSYHGTSDKVEDYITNCDAVVLPSYREGLPRVLLEAMACSKPIITTQTAGCEDVSKFDNAITVPIKDYKALEDALEQFINMDKEQRKTMGTNGRRAIDSIFAQEKIVELYNSHWEKIFKTNL